MFHNALVSKWHYSGVHNYQTFKIPELEKGLKELYRWALRIRFDLTQLGET
jgi:hypothetical protein